MKRKGPQQLTFERQLFKKPLPERLAQAKAKTLQKLKERNASIESTKKYLELNERYMGSTERHLEEAELNEMRKKQSSTQKGLSKIRAIEIRESLKKGKYLRLPEFNPNNAKMKPKLIAFAKKIDLERIKIIGAEQFRQDWVVVDARRRDTASGYNDRVRNFSASSVAYVWDIYRIGQGMVAEGNKLQQKLGLQLIEEVHKLFDWINELS